jgi:hypothetical protein
MAKKVIDFVELDLEITALTDKAVRVTDGDEYCWIAKSLIHNFDESWEVGVTYEMSIPEWVAENEGLI